MSEVYSRFGKIKWGLEVRWAKESRQIRISLELLYLVKSRANYWGADLPAWKENRGAEILRAGCLGCYSGRAAGDEWRGDSGLTESG